MVSRFGLLGFLLALSDGEDMKPPACGEPV